MRAQTLELAAATQSDPRWAAVVARDTSADGRFWYSVRTTGVYCRPSCKSRLARPENVRFHASTQDAQRAGFRACKRCKPDQAAEVTQADAIGFAIGSCALGLLLVACTRVGVCAILPGDDRQALRDDLHRRFPRARLMEDGVEARRWLEAVLAFMAAPEHVPAPPLDLRGTAFQQRVWTALRSIPAGCTVSYTQIARQIGSPTASRAVAAACAANPVAVIVPCHRVVRSDGALSGYRWGSERKRALLAHEARA